MQPYSSSSVVAFPWHPEEIGIPMNELKENSLNQKSKSRLSLEIIQYKPAPLLPAVAMEISPTIFG